VLAAAVAVVLLGLVAVGSLRGPLGSGRGRPRYPADLIDSLILLLVLAMLAAAVLAAIAMWTDRRMIGRRPRRGGNLSLLLPMAAVLLLWLFRDLFGLGGGGDDPPATTLPDQSTIDPAVPPPDPGVVPLVVAGLALAAMIGLAVAQLLSERRRRNLLNEVLGLATVRLRRALEASLREDADVQELLDEVVARRLDPASAASAVLERGAIDASDAARRA